MQKLIKIILLEVKIKNLKIRLRNNKYCKSVNLLIRTTRTYLSLIILLRRLLILCLVFLQVFNNFPIYLIKYISEVLEALQKY